MIDVNSVKNFESKTDKIINKYNDINKIKNININDLLKNKIDFKLYKHCANIQINNINKNKLDKTIIENEINSKKNESILNSIIFWNGDIKNIKKISINFENDSKNECKSKYFEIYDLINNFISNAIMKISCDFLPFLRFESDINKFGNNLYLTKKICYCDGFKIFFDIIIKEINSSNLNEINNSYLLKKYNELKNSICDKQLDFFDDLKDEYEINLFFKSILNNFNKNKELLKIENDKFNSFKQIIFQILGNPSNNVEKKYIDSLKRKKNYSHLLSEKPYLFYKHNFDNLNNEKIKSNNKYEIEKFVSESKLFDKKIEENFDKQFLLN